MFLDHTQRRTTVGTTPLDEWSARRRDLYLTTHDTHNRQIFMPPVGFEPTISAGERPQAWRFGWARAVLNMLSKGTVTGRAAPIWMSYEESHLNVATGCTLRGVILNTVWITTSVKPLHKLVSGIYDMQFLLFPVYRLYCVKASAYDSSSHNSLPVSQPWSPAVYFIITYI